MSEALSPTERTKKIPEIIQGGMGVGVSNWLLAGEVAGDGGMGVVSGIANDVIMARRLQDGDLDGAMRWALKAFPDQEIAETILNDYYLPNGRNPDQPYKNVPMINEQNLESIAKLNMAATFAEVWLAKQIANTSNREPGMVGINLLTKLQLPTFSTLYGAMLADVDCVIMGAGIPYDIPEVLGKLAKNERVATKFYVTNSKIQDEIAFDPANYKSLFDNSKITPAFLAIVSSNTLATRLSRNTVAPNGFVIEGPTAGGHNAPPRDTNFDLRDQPIYNNRDQVILENIVKLGLPFWLAGGYGTPEGLKNAKMNGANGIQAGSAFALCEESGINPVLRGRLIQQAINGNMDIFTSSKASPTGFPFKVALSPQPRERRACDLGSLREAYYTEVNGKEIISYRCPAEPEEIYVRKGGERIRTIGRECLCNCLFANIGLGQIINGEREKPIVTLGDHTPELVRRLVGKYGLRFSARNVLEFLRDAN